MDPINHCRQPRLTVNYASSADLDDDVTLFQGGHVDDASYRLNTADKDWTLDIKRNKYVWFHHTTDF